MLNLGRVGVLRERNTDYMSNAEAAQEEREPFCYMS